MHIGVDIGGTHFGVGLINNEYNIIKKEYVKIQATDTKDIVVSKFLATIKCFMQYGDIEDIGVGIPGICNLDTNIIYLEDKPVWKNISIIDLLKKEIHIPIFFDNDANCAAIASFNVGELKNVKNGLFITIGTGVGVGTIIDRKLYRGSNYTSGELGHMTLIVDGTKCDCGQKGCFEKYASLQALKNIIKENNYDIKDLIEVFQSNNEGMINIVNKWVEYMSIGISNICNILDISNIVIGGGASEYFEYFGEKLQNLVNDKIFYKSRKIVIQKSVLLNDAGIIGAAMLGREFKV